jgi:CHAD domain-containing protein
MKSYSKQEALTDQKEEILLSRKQVADRWSVSLETIKRREAAGVLHPLRFSARQVRYRLSDVVTAEQSAE